MAANLVCHCYSDERFVILGNGRHQLVSHIDQSAADDLGWFRTIKEMVCVIGWLIASGTSVYSARDDTFTIGVQDKTPSRSELY